MRHEVTVCPLQFQITGWSYHTLIAHVIAIPLHPQGDRQIQQHPFLLFLIGSIPISISISSLTVHPTFSLRVCLSFLDLFPSNNFFYRFPPSVHFVTTHSFSTLLILFQDMNTHLHFHPGLTQGYTETLLVYILMFYLLRSRLRTFLETLLSEGFPFYPT